MRFLKIYGGAVLIILSSIVLYLAFSNTEMDKATYNMTLVGCFVGVVLGVVLCVLGGKMADKIGDK